MPKRIEIVALILGGIGIFILDLAFNGSSESDLFFPPQLRKVLPVLKNTTLPSSPAAPAALGGYLPPGQNIYLYIIGGALLGVAMLVLIVTNRNSGKDLNQGP